MRKVNQSNEQLLKDFKEERLSWSTKDVKPIDKQEFSKVKTALLEHIRTDGLKPYMFGFIGGSFEFNGDKMDFWNYRYLLEEGYPTFKDYLKYGDSEFLRKQRIAQLSDVLLGTKTLNLESNKKVGIFEYLSLLTKAEIDYTKYNDFIEDVISYLRILEGYEFDDSVMDIKREERDYGSIVGLTLVVRTEAFKYYKHERKNKEYLERGLDWALDYFSDHLKTKEFLNTLNDYDKKVAAMLCLFCPTEMNIEKYLKEISEHSIFMNEGYENVILDVLKQESFLNIEKIRYKLSDTKKFLCPVFVKTADYSSVLNELINTVENDLIKNALLSFSKDEEKITKMFCPDNIDINSSDLFKLYKEQLEVLTKLQNRRRNIKRYPLSILAYEEKLKKRQR